MGGCGPRAPRRGEKGKGKEEEEKKKRRINHEESPEEERSVVMRSVPPLPLQEKSCCSLVGVGVVVVAQQERRHLPLVAGRGGAQATRWRCEMRWIQGRAHQGIVVPVPCGSPWICARGSPGRSSPRTCAGCEETPLRSVFGCRPPAGWGPVPGEDRHREDQEPRAGARARPLPALGGPSRLFQR